MTSFPDVPTRRSARFRATPPGIATVAAMSREMSHPDAEIDAADGLAREGRYAEAIEAYLEAAGEEPSGRVCLGLARSQEGLGSGAEARRWALAVTDAGAELPAGRAAAGIARRNVEAAGSPSRPARLAV